MRLIGIAFLLLISIQPSLSQIKSTKAGIDWSKEFIESKRFAFKNIISCDTNGFYTLKTDSRSRSNILIEFFNEELTISRSAEIKLNEKGKRSVFEFVLELNDKLLVFFSVKDQDVKKKFLYAQEIDKAKLELSGEKMTVASSSIFISNNPAISKYNYQFAADSTHLLIYQSLSTYNADSSKYNLFVYDQNLSNGWKKQLTLPLKNELFQLEDILLNSVGDVYLVGRQFKELDEDEFDFNDFTDFTYTILPIKKNNDQIDIIELHLDSMQLTDMRITFDGDNKLKAGGFYSEEGVIGIKGCFFIHFDPNTQELLQKTTHEFEEAFTNVNRIQRSGQKTIYEKPRGNDYDSFQYQLSEFLPKKDGSMLLIAEQFDQNYITNAISSFGGISTTSIDYIYHRNDIVVMNISVNGQILWVEQISKSQSTKNDKGYFTSYALSIIDEDLYFVFNDNHKNLLYNGNQKTKSFDKGKESLVVLTHLDGDGRQTREALFSLREADLLARPQLSKQTSDSELILFSQRRNTYRLARLRFE